jgi:hypothetical protein
MFLLPLQILTTISEALSRLRLDSISPVPVGLTLSETVGETLYLIFIFNARLAFPYYYASLMPTFDYSIEAKDHWRI